MNIQIQSVNPAASSALATSAVSAHSGVANPGFGSTLQAALGVNSTEAPAQPSALAQPAANTENLVASATRSLGKGDTKGAPFSRKVESDASAAVSAATDPSQLTASVLTSNWVPPSNIPAPMQVVSQYSAQPTEDAASEEPLSAVAAAQSDALAATLSNALSPNLTMPMQPLLSGALQNANPPVEDDVQQIDLPATTATNASKANQANTQIAPQVDIAGAVSFADASAALSKPLTNTTAQHVAVPNRIATSSKSPLTNADNATPVSNAVSAHATVANQASVVEGQQQIVQSDAVPQHDVSNVIVKTAIAPSVSIPQAASPSSAAVNTSAQAITTPRASVDSMQPVQASSSGEAAPGNAGGSGHDASAHDSSNSSSETSISGAQPDLLAVASITTAMNTAVHAAIESSSMPSAVMVAAHESSAPSNSSYSASVLTPSSTSVPLSGAGDALAQAVQSARLISVMNGTEMRVGVHSPDFGSVSIATTMSKDGGISAQIALDHAGLGQALSEHLPAMEDKLGTALGMQARIEVRDTASSINSSWAGSGNMDANTQSFSGGSGNGGSRNAPASVAWGGSGEDSSAQVSMPASITAVEGLSIHA